jgi:hypothetical protein
LGSPSEEALAVYPTLEQNDNETNFDQDRDADPLQPMPLIVLSADEPYNLSPLVEDGSLPLTIDQAEEFGKLLFKAVVDARTNLVSQVPGAKHITETDSDHYIHQEQPQLVIDAIRQVVDAVRDGADTVGVVEGAE